MAQFELFDFVLIPLTPIHIGGGDEAKLGPENYRIRENRLERVNLRRLLLRENMAGLEMRGSFQEQAFERLRDKAGPADIEETIRLSPESAPEIGKKGALRQGRVDGFQRSGGAPVLPGSSVKGALRTAWLAHCAQGIAGRPRDCDDLAERAFALDPENKTDTDPLRDVTIEDARIANGDTVIDRIFTWKKASRGQYGFADTGQMHWELLRAVAGGGKPPIISLRIGLRGISVRSQRVRMARADVPTRAPADIGTLLGAVTAQHRPIWAADLERFFAGQDARLKQAMQLFSGLGFDGADPDAALVRLGRGGHAESKSVAPFRQVAIRNPKTRQTRHADHGTTRHVVKAGGAPVSLGWALLIRADRWQAPAGWLADPIAQGASGPAGIAPVPATPITHRAVLYRRGEGVVLNDGERAVMLEDLTAGMAEVRVNIAGDSEVVKPAEIVGGI